MQYNQSASGQGICQHTDYLAGTSVSTYPQADKDRSANIWLDTLIDEAIDAMDDFDVNSEIATNDLSATVQETPFPSDLLKIKRLEIDYNGDGSFTPCTPIDVNQYPDIAIATTAQVNAQFSQSNPYYGLFDDSAFMFPVPDADVTAGVKIWYSKDVTQMTATAAGNTATPNLPRQYHVGVSYGQTLDYARKVNNEDLVREMERALYGSTLTRKGKQGGLITKLRDFYSSRASDKINRLKSKYFGENYK